MRRSQIILKIVCVVIFLTFCFQYASKGYIIYKSVDSIAYADIKPSDDIIIQFSFGHWGNTYSRFEVKNGQFYEGGGLQLKLAQHFCDQRQGDIRYIRRKIPSTAKNQEEIWSTIENLLRPHDHRELFLGWTSSVKIIHKRSFHIPKVMEYVSPNTSLVHTLQCMGFDNRDLCMSAYLESNEEQKDSLILKEDF